MKILRKINKGLICTIVVIAVLAVFLVNVEASRNAEKSNIEEACKNYVSLTNTYVVMPSEYQKLYNADTYTDEVNKAYENVITKHFSECEEKLKEQMVDNETALDLQVTAIETGFECNNNVLSSITTKFTREITKITKYDFDDDQVTVTFNSTVEQEIKYLELDSETLEYQEMTKINSFDIEGEVITLKNVDGVWKVVYADLAYQDYEEYYFVL